MAGKEIRGVITDRIAFRARVTRGDYCKLAIRIGFFDLSEMLSSHPIQDETGVFSGTVIEGTRGSANGRVSRMPEIAVPQNAKKAQFVRVADGIINKRRHLYSELQAQEFCQKLIHLAVFGHPEFYRFDRHIID